MSEGEALGADFRGALESITVPSYVLDRTGVVRWVNPAAVELVGDVRGRHFTSIVAPEETQRTRELLASKIIGAVAVTETEGVLLRADRSRVTLKISAQCRSKTATASSVCSASLWGSVGNRGRRHTPTSHPARRRC